MRHQARRCFVLAFCSLVLVTPVRGQDAKPTDEAYFIPPLGLLPPVRVAAVEADGTIRLEPVPGQAQFQTLWGPTMEGHYLIGSPRSLPGQPLGPRPRQLDSLVRVEVIDVGEGGKLTAKSGAEAAKMLKVGDFVALVRPARMTTAQIRALPAVIPLIKEGDAKVPGNLFENLARARQAARRAQSVNNLKQIGLALHNFHSSNDNYPPAIVFGPDGKPWHSWRILIAPYLEATPVYNQYDFTQPWDSPKNRVLIDRMPAVYRDPLNGETTGSNTHYAALVGEKALFSPRGSSIQIVNGTASNGLFKGRSIREVTDGTSNTLAIVPVDPARKIPWTKPEDITVGDDFPGLGQPGGIFTPEKIDGVGAANLLFADGSVRILSDKNDPATIRALTTIAGGEIIDPRKLVAPAGLRSVRGGPPTLHLIRDGEKFSALIE
jgi:prepilin-type processing-associated H-X9-DG protein